MISTVDQLIEALGGSKKAADAFPTSKSALWDWRHSPGGMPLWARHKAKEIAQANGWPIDPELVGAKERVKYGTGPHARAARALRTASRSRPIKAKTKKRPQRARTPTASAAE